MKPKKKSRAQRILVVCKQSYPIQNGVAIAISIEGM
jgi:hypothetical protein